MKPPTWVTRSLRIWTSCALFTHCLLGHSLLPFSITSCPHNTIEYMVTAVGRSRQYFGCSLSHETLPCLWIASVQHPPSLMKATTVFLAPPSVYSGSIPPTPDPGVLVSQAMEPQSWILLELQSLEVHLFIPAGMVHTWTICRIYIDGWPPIISKL